MKATGIAARGWVWTAYDWDTSTLFNFNGDEQNTYPIWNGTPLVAMDCFEHAYWMDFGTGKAILTALIGWLVLMLPFFFMGALLAIVG